MTKKDYQAIARTIFRLYNSGRDMFSINDVISLLSDVFHKENARFDYVRFNEACLTGKCKGMRT